jgi:hypothetical protein
VSGAAFLRVAKLKGSGIIKLAARHNKREIQAELGAAGAIDPTRSRLNETLAGPAAAGDVGQLAKDLMTAAGVATLRKDAVMGLEVVFSLPPGHAIDDRAYFTDCAAWAGRYFGGVQNILSTDIHRDEAQPHCHVLILPLVNGRMDGSNLIGGKQKLLAMQKLFHLDVAGRYGLTKAPSRLAGASKQDAAQAVFKMMLETDDRAMQSAAWATIRAMIESDPGPFVQALGIELQAQKKKGKTMAQIFTGTGKGPSKEPNPIGFTPSEKRQTLCSVGFAQKSPLRTASNLPPTAPRAAPAGKTVQAPCKPAVTTEAPFIEPTRVERDSDYCSDRYDSDTGVFCAAPTAPARRQRRAADAWVKTALAATGR